MATRCPLPADHGYLTHLDGSVTLTRPCEDMEPAALMDLKAALTLLGDRAVNLRVSQPRLWLNMCAAMKVWLDRHECDRGALVLGDRRQWTAHREMVIKDTLGLCLAMRFTRRLTYLHSSLALLYHTGMQLNEASLGADGLMFAFPKPQY